MPIAAEINGRLYAIHTDHLNTPRRLTNQQGQVAWQWLISGFGEVRPTTGDRGYGQTVSGPSYAQAVKFDLRYPGQVFDEETGLSYNLHRYYDAATGRYIQADPIGLEGGWNRFGYVANNPLNDVDPQGLHPLLTRMQDLYYRYGWQGAVNPGTPSKLQLWQAPENKQVQDTIPVDMRGKRKNQIRLAFICIIQPAICKTNDYKISEPA